MSHHRKPESNAGSLWKSMDLDTWGGYVFSTLVIVMIMIFININLGRLGHSGCWDPYKFCHFNPCHLLVSKCKICGHFVNLLAQRFSEVPAQLGMAILFVIPENPLFPNPVLPKTSVYRLQKNSP